VKGKTTPPLLRSAIRVRGVVQGVGFRPAMHRLASALGLVGFVRNEVESVRIEVEGPPSAVTRFLEALPSAAPPAAHLRSIEADWLPVRGDASFRIEASLESDERSPSAAPLPADLAPCDACLAELRDQGDRRYRYPFINCTDCGPRFTIVERTPYDRARTSMASFTLCERCRAEYEDPLHRRFHAEPNACGRCGPRLAFVSRAGAAGAGVSELRGDDALRAATELLREGGALALKGVGGFVLAVDATDEAAVSRLRLRKRRPDKPLAVMGRDLEAIEGVALLDDEARRLITSSARPIVLVPKRSDPRSKLADGVAPRLGDVGVFLPPSPLQQLLLDEGPKLQVVTSGNLAGEPIVTDEALALERLGGLADGFLIHDRPILVRADDSVSRVIAGGPVPMRRARGYVPEAIALPVDGPPVLAVGGHDKVTVALCHRGQAILSPHIGDLCDPDARAFFEEVTAHLRRLAGIEPTMIAHDLHPDFASTRWARAQGLPTLAVQHHHAHVASCMAEHGVRGQVLGVAFDGTGLGPDGTLWGGELLSCGYGGYERLGHLRPLRLLGGEAAIREPWRLALAALVDAGEPFEGRLGHDAPRPEGARVLLRAESVHVQSTGAGRWFDVVAALVGVRTERATFDGQPAAELEAIAAREPCAPYDVAFVERSHAPFVVDLRPLVREVMRDLERDVGAPLISARFHETMARVVLHGSQRARARGAPATVVLTGGCFQNRRLTERSKALLERDGFEVLVHRLVPPNDGGLALGQAAIASHHAACRAEGGPHVSRRPG
jgi:hydrogenase maturation protein HypF